MTKQKSIAIIGSGFSGLTAAASLAQAGVHVEVFEKNEQLGGRARQFRAEGFSFDMGPSWYWMPEVFENFYSRFGKTTKDFYELVRLDPSYQVIFKGLETIKIPASLSELYKLFESIEPGSAKKLEKFLKEAEYKYHVGMNEFVWKPSLSIFEFMDSRIISSFFKLQMLSSISKQIRSNFKDKRLQQILEFPVLFLGEKPQNTPALYSLMNFADLSLGTWYPKGGMYEIVKAMLSICREQGVKFHTNAEVSKINAANGRANSLVVNGKALAFDAIISSADYHHTDKYLLDKEYANYTDQYWDKRKLAPSSLLFYLGVNKRLKNLKHHNLFFVEDFDQHAEQIYDNPQWPDNPLFYVCNPSKTDDKVAPLNSENIFILIPIATDLKDLKEKHEYYFDRIIQVLEEYCEDNIRENIVYKKSFSVSDFKKEYHSYKGNAYGLANTLRQTAFLKPRIRNKKLSNLFYTGQLTVPGPGVPPSIVSGQLVADYVLKQKL